MELTDALHFMADVDQLEAAAVGTVLDSTREEKQLIYNYIGDMLKSTDPVANVVGLMAVAGVARALYNGIENELIENITWLPKNPTLVL